MIAGKIIYFIMLYAVLAYNVLYQTHDGMVMLIFVAAASLASLTVMLVCGFNLKCGYDSSAIYVHIKDEFEIKYRIKNTAPFPVVNARLLTVGQKKAQSFVVGAGSETCVAGKERTEHCGCRSIEVKGVCLYDFFRVFRFRIKNPGVVKIISLPRLFDVNIEDYIYTMTGIQENEGKGKERSGSEISEIRPYADGDNIKNIHHKLSSRMSSLMVKEYIADEEEENVYVFYQADKAGTDTADNMLELMYNMMNLKLKQKGKVTGYIPGATAVEAGMRYGIATNDELDLFFEKIFDGFASPHMHISCPDGAKIYAADVTQELVEFSMEAQAGNTVMYVPAECKKAADMLLGKVVQVFPGGGSI